MIILSGVLVVLAIALLVTGIVTGNTGHEIAGLDGLKLIYVSIGVSIISALCLAIGVFLRRKELFGSAESEASAKKSAATRSTKATRTAKTKARVGAGDDAPVTVTPAAATEVPAETSVFVVPGRKRYHLETCRQLAGRDKEELTFVEAREEGFTACTACLPDTALAARAAFTEPGETAPTESLDTAAGTEDSADTADLTATDDDPALVTRTDLPVTKLTDDELAEREDADEDLDTYDAEPAEESPAVAGVPEAPEPDAFTEPEPPADTTRFDQIPESDTAPTPATERPLARSRSLFEPLDHEDPATTDDVDTDETATLDTEDEPAADVTDTTADEDTDEGLDEVTDEDTDADRHVDAELDESEPDEADEPEHESPAESAAASDATETSVADEEAQDEHDDDTAEPIGTAAAAEDASPATADEPTDTPDESEPDDEAPGEPADTEPSEPPDLPFVRILSGTKRYHRPDCALIEDIAEDADDLEILSPAEAKERGCTPCLVCQPDKDPEDRY